MRRSIKGINKSDNILLYFAFVFEDFYYYYYSNIKSINILLLKLFNTIQYLQIITYYNTCRAFSVELF